ncbi:acetate/propionate family kinase [Zhaonella formicivorans]|uniref:acetate/propionate family kinase n=1 Tax=Zhaonella formicivorans TaxID=2528593 RepID=UPI0010D1F4C4|nr:acetate kinase [Zhaonella formicivorans]
MKVLVLNCGSSSIKYQLFNMEDESVLAKGLVERIGLQGAVLTHRPSGKEKKVIAADIPDHSVGIKMVLEAMVHPEHGVLTKMEEIDAVGHRVAHGGSIFPKSALIDAQAKESIKSLFNIAPLHNPPAYLGIEAVEKALPGVPMVAVFDTSFHQTMPPAAYMYSLPYELYEKYGLRKYGFHGTSHKYVAYRAAALLNRPIEELKIITCHLGNGASITAIDGGKSIDTSMGFTPLEGLTMGTRCGDLDPAIVTFLEEQEGLSCSEVNNLLNKKSGVLGISGVSSDFRDIEEAAAQGNKRAQLALDVFAHDVKKYIGAYAAALNGLDVIVFTAGLGENSPEMREKICKDMEFFGIKLDGTKNKIRGQEADVSADDSKVRIMVIPTNEELVIARDTKQIVEQ